MKKNLNWVPNKNINNILVNNLLKESLKNNQFTNYGPNVQLLENKIKEIYKINNNKSVIVVSNGSIAIQLLAKTIEIYHNKNINWTTQSFTFPPSLQMNLSNTDIIDIDLEGGIDLNEIKENQDGLIITNVFGNIVNIDKYLDYCKKNNKYLIFDNAATHYTFYKNKNCLNYGDGCIISFHHTKPFGFGEGGAIIVDKKYEETIRKLINFGINLYEDKYYSSEGNNCKMSDISAVYILQYLEDHFDIIINKHQELYNYLENKIQDLNIKLFPSFHDKNKNCVSCFCLLFENYELSKKIENVLLENNIFCRKYYHPLKETKNTLTIYNKILCIPCNIDMNIQDIDFILELINNNL